MSYLVNGIIVELWEGYQDLQLRRLGDSGDGKAFFRRKTQTPSHFCLYLASTIVITRLAKSVYMYTNLEMPMVARMWDLLVKIKSRCKWSQVELYEWWIAEGVDTYLPMLMVSQIGKFFETGLVKNEVDGCGVIKGARWIWEISLKGGEIRIGYDSTKTCESVINRFLCSNHGIVVDSSP